MVASSAKWRMVRLGELATFRNGLNFSKKNFGTGLRFIGVSDFQDYSFPRYGELDEINPVGVAGEDDLLAESDILFVRSNGNRSLIGRSLFIRDLPEAVSHSGFTIRLRFNSDLVHPRFYAHLFRTELIRQVLSAHGGGTNINNLNQQILKALEVPIPSKAEQVKIAAVLSAYDDLIENNERRIKILEEMAQNLYREWFVNFRFPGHERVKMVDSPLGKIPEGWEVVKLGELYKTASGGTPSRKRAEYYGGEISWLKTKELNDGFVVRTEECITELGMKKSSAKLFPRGTVIIAMYGATIGRLGILTHPTTTNQACCAILSSSPPFGMSFAFLTLLEKRADLVGLGQGAAQQNISQIVIKSYSVVKPSEVACVRFNEFADPVMGSIERLTARNRVLRQTRDLLLPRLISGELDVSELDIDVPEEAA